MGYLLDSNILIALLDPEHEFRDLCMDWFESTGHRDWYTSPTTENGAIRVLCSPAYGIGRQQPGEVIARLESLLPLGNHQFLSEHFSMRNHTVFDRERLRGTKQVTDTYLLGVAVVSDVFLATMDQRIDVATVHGGSDHLLLLS